MMKQGVVKILLVTLCLFLSGPTRTAEQPLSQDDVLLLLLGGATSEKMVALIRQRGVNFQMNPDLAKKFHDAGAGDDVIEALQKAGANVKPAAPSAPQAPPSPPAATSTPSNSPAPTPASAASPRVPEARLAGVSLPDPSSDQFQQIIREFAAKETLFKEARNNYTYHQVNKVDELGPDNETVGTFQQEWDILYDDAGKRIERVTYAPADSLKGLLVTKEDYDRWRSIQPFVLTTDELPEYEIKYLGHVKVDEITAYVFSIRPKEIKRGRLYFQGVAWVDDRDLQIVKTEGKTVPETKGKGGQNLFPRFTTWREQIDGKFWFPTYTMSDDTLYFPNMPPVHIKEVIRYTDYKQFKSKVRILSATPTDQPNAPAIPIPANKPN